MFLSSVLRCVLALWGREGSLDVLWARDCLALKAFLFSLSCFGSSWVKVCHRK